MYRAKGRGLCKQVFMSRSEDLPITVCGPTEFLPFSHLPVSRNRFLDIQYLELFVVDRTYKFDSQGGQGVELVWCWFWFSTPDTSCQLTSLILNIASRRISLLEEGFLCLFNLVSDDPAMIGEAGEWSLVNDSQFPGPHSLSSFSRADPRHWDLGSCFLPQSRYFAFNQANSHPIHLWAGQLVL